MERLARLVMRHRLIVSLFWLVTFVLGGIAAGQLSDRLTLDFSLPGQPGDIQFEPGEHANYERRFPSQHPLRF